MTSALVELRVLEGPNLYFPRAAIKLTLDLTQLIDAPTEVALRFASRVGLERSRPGEPGSGFRQRFAARAIERLLRQIAAEAGTTRLAVRVRPTHDVHQVVVAFPWRNRTRAQTLGQAVAEVLDALPSPDLDDTGRAGRRVGPLLRARPRAHDAAPAGADRGGHRHQREDHHLPDGRAHRPRARPARRLVEHRRDLHRRRAGRARRLLRSLGRRPGAGAPAGRSWRSPRPPAAGSCSRASGWPTTTSRSSPTSRRTTSASRASTPSTSSRRSREWCPGSPAQTGGRC